MHDHTCPDCSRRFPCEVPFCDGLPNLMCDSCWEADAKIVPHPDGGYQQVVEYAREREEQTAA